MNFELIYWENDIFWRHFPNIYWNSKTNLKKLKKRWYGRKWKKLDVKINSFINHRLMILLKDTFLSLTLGFYFFRSQILSCKILLVLLDFEFQNFLSSLIPSLFSAFWFLSTLILVDLNVVFWVAWVHFIFRLFLLIFVWVWKIIASYVFMFLRGFAALKDSFYEFEQPDSTVWFFILLCRFPFDIFHFLSFFPLSRYPMLVVFVYFCSFISLLLLFRIVFVERPVFQRFWSYFHCIDSWSYSCWRNSIIQKVFPFSFSGFQRNHLNVIDPNIQLYLETYSLFFRIHNNFNNLRYR